jgi:hypothetical protein
MLASDVDPAILYSDFDAWERDWAMAEEELKWINLLDDSLATIAVLE